MSTVSTRKPRFNHVAMSLPPDLLDPANRDEIVRFYREVFGWEEIPQMTIDRQRLVLSAYTYEQFVFLIADEPPMECPRLDHFGISVQTEAELDDMLARATAFREHDDRVDIVDKKVDDYEMLAITSFYVRYRLPMMVEVQWWDFKGHGPDGR
ncbi:MAG TPA: VOC family protein [Acidimicrobiia bacterium]|nr:VOC family protein [Acidimicrobiia bacterium]